jgi:hypothetical protein
MNTLSVPIIFADDTSVIIYSTNFDDFCILSNRAISHTNKWCTANKLAVDLDKMNAIKFITIHHDLLDIGYNEKKKYM